MSEDHETRDAALTALYSPRVAPDLSHLIGITSRVIDTEVVRSTDWDEMQARAAQPAPSVTPNAPAANPSATTVDLGSARTATGERIADVANLTADSIVAYAGTETSIAVLLGMGLVARNPATGFFQAVGASEVTQAQELQQQPQQAAPEQNVPLDEASEAILTDVMTRAPETATGAATSYIVRDGAISDEAVHQLAADLGIEPEIARERIAHVGAAFAKEAEELGAKAAGVTREISAEALAWARENQGPELHEAAERHFREGRADYKPFITNFLANLDQTDPQRILQANPIPGRSVHWDRSAGVVVVTLGDGSQVSWATAVRAGWIALK